MCVIQRAISSISFYLAWWFQVDLWAEVKKLEGKTLYTLEQKEPFLVVQVLHDRVIIENSKNNERPIRWSEIRGAWGHLEQHGTITRAEIMESFSSYNSAYLAAILANLEEVSTEIAPITLRLKNRQNP